MTLARRPPSHLCNPPAVYRDEPFRHQALDSGDLWRCDDCGRWWIVFFHPRYHPPYLWKRAYRWIERLRGATSNVQRMDAAERGSSNTGEVTDDD